MATKKEVDGVDDVIAVFGKLPNALKKGVWRKSCRAVAKNVLTDAKARVPVAFGALQDSLVVRSSASNAKRGVIGASVRTRDGMFSGDEFYGGMQEFGYHQRDGKWNDGQPYLRPALYDDRAGHRETFTDESRRLFDGVVKSTAKKKTKFESDLDQWIALNRG